MILRLEEGARGEHGLGSLACRATMPLALQTLSRGCWANQHWGSTQGLWRRSLDLRELRARGSGGVGWGS